MAGTSFKTSKLPLKPTKNCFILYVIFNPTQVLFTTVTELTNGTNQPKEKPPVDRRKFRKKTPYERIEPKLELDAFLADYFVIEPRAMIFTVLPGYSKKVIPPSRRLPVPPSLSTLYKKDMVDKPSEELQEYCRNLYPSLLLSQKESDIVEFLTRKQSQSKLWFSQRIGLITGSIVKSVLGTPISSPSHSLIVKICQPNAAFYSEPTE